MNVYACKQSEKECAIGEVIHERNVDVTVRPT